jgi:hypothetical protein
VLDQQDVDPHGCHSLRIEKHCQRFQKFERYSDEGNEEENKSREDCFGQECLQQQQQGKQKEHGKSGEEMAGKGRERGGMLTS